MANKLRLMQLDNIKRNAYTQTFPDTKLGRQRASNAWRAVVDSPFTLCAVLYSEKDGHDLKRLHIGQVGEWSY